MIKYLKSVKESKEGEGEERGMMKSADTVKTCEQNASRYLETKHCDPSSQWAEQNREMVSAAGVQNKAGIDFFLLSLTFKYWFYYIHVDEGALSNRLISKLRTESFQN